jgi:hypothetical protein
VTAIEDLVEVATRASRAGSAVRSAKWQEKEAIARMAARVRAELRDERAGLRRPCSAVAPSPSWSRRLDELAQATEPDADAAASGAAVAEADAAAAVTAARIALGEAYLAVLTARLAAIDAGDVEDAIRGHRPLPASHPAAGHAWELAGGLRAELRHIVRGRPRSVPVRLGTGFGLGLAYLGVLRLFHWERTEPYLPYLAVFALSVVMGSVVCTNAMSIDAGRVRAALSGGTRLWHVLLSKNLALLLLVGATGILLGTLLAWYVNDPGALLTASGELFTMILIWLGVGNVMSVLRPLRHEPLAARRHDGTLRPFFSSLVISYLVGHLVNLMVIWRVWAQQAAIAETGRILLPVLLTVGSAALVWMLLTVVAVALAERPVVRRGLLAELVEYRASRRPGLEEPWTSTA